MANLFWGVSDALDLYDEYINAKKLKVQRSQSPLKEVDAEITTAQKIENENDSKGLNILDEDAKKPEVFKDCRGNSEKGDGGDGGDGEVYGTTEKKDPSSLNAETNGSYDNDENYDDDDNNDSRGLNISNSGGFPKCIEGSQKTGNDVAHLGKIELAGQIDKQNTETHIEGGEDCANRIEDSNIKNFKVDHYNKELENYEEITEITKESSEIIKSTEMTDCKEEKTTDIALEQDSKLDEENLNNDNLNIEMELEFEIDTSESEITEFKNDPQATYRKMEDPIKQENTASSDDRNPDTNPNNVNSSHLEITNDCVSATEGQTAGEETNSVTTAEHNSIIDNGDPNPNDPNISNQETFEETKPRVLNILIFGGGDPRHIIKTMAKRYTHRQDESTAASIPTLKFYIIEGCMEIVARDIVLLGIALERPELISLRNRVHLFMDVYGNSLLRPICHQYLVSKSVTLLKMVSDSETLQEIAPFIHIDDLKYREIDALQDAFEFWQPKPGYDFNIKDYWMNRIRQLLAVRYDVRDGVFDWDLNMSLKDRGGQQICSQEYRYWRETGIAFTFPEYEQCKPNKTLSAGLVRNGSRYIHRGYIGDVQTGPFCTFGLRSLEERMHRSAHGENDYRATDVTERNLLEYFHEIQSGTPYKHDDSISHKYGGVRFQMGERLIHNEFEMKNICAYDRPWINVDGVEIHFPSLHEVKNIGKGDPKWENFFDIAFVGYKFFEFLNDEFPKVLRENSLLILETKLRSVEVKNRISEFETELFGFARDANLSSVLNYNALNSKNSILKFWKPEKSSEMNIKKIY